MLFYLLMSVNENLKTKARGIVSFFVELESIKMCTLGLEVKGKVD